MKLKKNDYFRPLSIRLDASTVCQVKCPSCPNTSGDIARHLGSGFLTFEDFKDTIDRNPWVSHIELANWGEIFLNRELKQMVQYAHKKNIGLSANNGANLNHVPEGILESLVIYEFRGITCSIDGATPETYSIYRVNGNFERVIQNIRTINKYKTLYQSRYPSLRWQFVPFGHNEHEIGLARRMAVDLNMDFHLKLSWEDLYGLPFSPIRDPDFIRRESGVGVSTRNEYREKYGKEYALRGCCTSLWKSPQISYDGRVLGCPVNFWGDYGNAFREGLLECVNNEKIQYAREMLTGEKEAKEGIPCATCPSYLGMKENKAWLSVDEVKDGVRPRETVKHRLKRIGRRFRPSGSRLLSSRIDDLSLPLQPDEEKGWRPYPIFHGTTKGMSDLSCHVSVLSPDRIPHLPHIHQEEELLLLLKGEVDLVFPHSGSPYGNRRQNLKPGQFVYYPAEFSHTLQTVSESPAIYLMFKWFGPAKHRVDQLDYRLFDANTHMERRDEKEGFSCHRIFQGPTAYLEKLHCHTSILTPGSGYDPHTDPYDVAIIVLGGEIETLGKRVIPYGVIFYAADEPHGIFNPGDTMAKYIVFEFHPRKTLLDRGFRRIARGIHSPTCQKKTHV